MNAKILCGIVFLCFFLALTVSTVCAQDAVSPDGKVGVRLGGDGGTTQVYGIGSGAVYGTIGGGTGAAFSPDSQSVTIMNAKIDSFGTRSNYKIFCRH
ncbi:MAG: hypothetical protein PHE61_04920 [Candidatus Omnitrophica bacterium]|nr:hypothetical protein [Candidatus Omnitrophota bacterium]